MRTYRELFGIGEFRVLFTTTSLNVAAGSVGSLALVTGGEMYDAVLLLGVLMYLPASGPVVAELAAHVAPGGFLALAIRTATSALWRPAARQDWQAALAAFGEHDLARAEARDMRYLNEIGAPARADSVDALTSAAGAYGQGGCRVNRVLAG